ncbi:MAG: DUF1844 domain-containing protein [Terriglobales bacterium]
MAEKRKESEFKVSDRRLFTADGELRASVEEEPQEQPRQTEQSAMDGPAPTTSSGPAATAHANFDGQATAAAPQTEAVSEPPTASEQQAQHDAYRESARDLDRRVELSGRSAQEFEVNFERFMASLYMTAMMQLGLMHEQGGQPTVDLVGARQTVDTLGMLAEKTKGNLTPKEQGFLQNCLYELRMAYVEVTNALARTPLAPGPSTGTNG